MMGGRELSLNQPNLIIGALGILKIGVKSERKIRLMGRGQKLQEEGCEENETNTNVMTHGQILD